MRQALITDILNAPAGYTASKWMIERIPFIFGNDLQSYIQWKEHLSFRIGVDSKAIVLIGTSSVGFSLNPEKDFKPFDQDSDIDVAVISAHHFDVAWHYLRNIGPKYHRLKPREQNAIDDHRQRLIYYGTIATDRIVHLLPFRFDWVKAMTEMSKVDPTKDHDINFRIYKDFEALKSYHVNGINKLKEQLLKSIV